MLEVEPALRLARAATLLAVQWRHFERIVVSSLRHVAIESMHEIMRHLPDAPPRVHAAQCTSEQALPASRRHGVIDRDRDPGTSIARNDPHCHAILADHQESGRANCLPFLELRRNPVYNDALDIERKPQHSST